MPDFDEFVDKVWSEGARLYRDFPWRRTSDPYGIWVSEVMLQQTQTSRVDGRWQRWMERFPSVEALASADVADVLEEWQGMGYNRRALSLRTAARELVEHGGAFPQGTEQLMALPGVGPATAAGIRAFAFDLHAVYLETNVRAVFIHELFPGTDKVADKELIPLVDAACPLDGGETSGVCSVSACPGSGLRRGPRAWYYALLDYGAYLKRTLPNPSRRSTGHARQSRFEGSHRQKRAELVRVLLAAREEGVSLEAAAASLNGVEVAAGREPVNATGVAKILGELVEEGYCYQIGNIWRV